MATLEEVKAVARQMDAAKDALHNYLEGPHEHNDPTRNQLLAAVNRTMEAYIRLISEPPDDSSS